MTRALRDCPCQSRRPFVVCCEPLLDGDAQAESPEQLMRSRYTAYSLGMCAYLWQTLAREHPDKQRAESAFVGALTQALDAQRFAGLRVLEHSADADPGWVLFYARVYVRGADHSFAELSRFVREDGRWRYASGLLLEKHLLRDPKTLTRSEFLAIASAQGAK